MLMSDSKKFNLKLLLENKIQGLGFIFSDKPTLCKTNHQTSLLLKDPGPFLTDLICFPFEGHYVYREFFLYLFRGKDLNSLI